MRKSLALPVLVGLLVSATLLAQDDDKPPSARLEGTWQLVAFRGEDGVPLPDEKVKELTLTFAKDTFTMKDGDEVYQAGTGKYNNARRPPWVDAKVTEGFGNGTTMLGVFDVQGDEMKYAFDLQGRKRPEKVTGGPGYVAAVAKRKK